MSHPFPALRESWDYPVPAGFKPENRVYMMQQILEMDDVRFASLRLRDQNELMDKTFQLASQHPNQLNRLRKRWKAPQVTDAVSTWNDIPLIDVSYPAFSKRAVDALEDLLERDGILLPLKCPGRKFYAFVPRFRDDVLDLSRSHIDWHYETRQKQVYHIHRYMFYADRLKDTSIFGVARQPSRVYVTNTFVERVKQAGLLGATYQIVFPLKPATSWSTLADRVLAKHLRDGLPSGQKLDGKKVVVKFLTDYPYESTTPEQDKRINSWAENVQDLLRDRDSLRVGVGQVFNVWPQVSGGVSVNLHGPDLKKLVTQLLKMIPDAKWPGKVKISARGMPVKII